MPKKTGAGATTLTIAGVQVPVSLENVQIAELRLDPDNPRIRFQFLHGGRKKPKTAGELFEIVRAQAGYPALQKQIRKQRGLHDPLIVRHDGRIVEGNTRFAAVSFLAEHDQDTTPWMTVPVMRLSKDVPEVTVQLLMAEYHIAGKTTWRPAAQADEIYRLLEEEGASEEQVMDATRMTSRQVQQHLAAYRFLVEEVIPKIEEGGPVDRQAVLESKFSHALELMQRRNLQHIREHAEDRQNVAKLIAEDKIQGREIRELPKLMGNTRAKAVLTKQGFKAATETLKKADPTIGSPLLSRLQKTTLALAEMTQKDLELFKAETKAQKALLDLIEAAEAVAEIVKARSRKRSAR